MGTTKLQVSLNPKRMIDLGRIKSARGVPAVKGVAGYKSDDVFAKELLLEKIDAELEKLASQ